MAARNGRRPRRRGRFGFLYKVLSFVLILGAIIGGCIVFFRVEQIDVVGSTVYTDQEIIAASEVELDDNLFLINHVTTGRKILAQLPYIKEVNPRLALPSTLILTVTECTPVAVVDGGDGAWWVIDSSGKLLEKGGTDLARQYPQITGLEPLKPSEGGRLAVAVEESTKLNSLKQILAALEGRDMLAQTQSMDLSAVTEICLRYEGRFSVRIPMYSDDFNLQIHTLEEIAAYLNAGQVGTIDLTGSRPRFIPD